MSEDIIQTISLYTPEGKHSKTWIDDYNIPKNSIEPTLFIESLESPSYHPNSMHLMLIHGIYVAHHESEPAYVTKLPKRTVYQFFIKGKSCKIENLPCEDEVKCMLKLKYTEVPRINDYITYV